MSRDSLGWQLYKASCDGRVEEVRRLLEQGALVNWGSQSGYTPLMTARANRAAVMRVVLEYKPDINQQDDVGNTAAHWVCWSRSIECLELLIATGQCDLGITNSNGRTSLGVAVYWERLDIVKYFITECSVDVNDPINKQGDTPLGLAVKQGQLETVEYLVTECSAKPDEPKPLMEDILKLVVNRDDVDFLRVLVSKHTVDVSKVMSLAVEQWQLGIIKFLVTECRVDVDNPINKQGDTPLGLAVREGRFETVEYLITECKAKPDGSHLILALQLYTSKSKHEHMVIIRYLLTDCHCDPNGKDEDGHIPLALAPDKETIQLLLRHGAIAKDAYALHKRALSNVFSKDPLKNPVKMFVIGHGSEGKSTLIEAMEHEPSIFSPLVNIFIKPKEVKGVDQRTAGIIPRTFKSRFYGDVQFYDFAGQEAYYSSHAAVIKSAVDTSSPIFLFVVGLHRGDTTIIQSVSYWLGIIADQCGNMEGKAPLIVVASHADLVTDQAEVDRKKQIISQTVKRFSTFDMVEIFPLDCRFSNSNGMKTLRSSVGISCDSVRAKLAVSLNSHMLLIYLLDNYPNEIAITLEQLKQKIEQDKTSQELTKKHKQTLTFIPIAIPRLVEICIQLSDKGHILFLQDTLMSEKSCIIIDKTKLLGEVNGTMFAPEDFKQHCKLATSTGVVPRSKLAAHFSELDINMLIGFLSHLELAIPIEDEEVLSLIEQHFTATGELQIVDKEDDFVFCPALIRLKVPDKVFEYQHDCDYHFGWVLSCVGDDDFFNARFLHVCILRLSLTFGHDPESSVVTNPAIQRRCSVWTTGVCWATRSGIQVLVEVLNKKHVNLLIQASSISFELLQLQSTVVKSILRATSEFCSTITHREILLPSTKVAYPLDISELISNHSLKSVAESILHHQSHVISTTGTNPLPLSQLLPADVYTNLGENILQPLFNENDPVHNKPISNRFLSALSSSWNKNPQLVDIIRSTIAKETPDSYDDLENALKLWRDVTIASYRNLRQLLDSLSVFAGRSPLELAGMSPKPFCEELLPHSQPTVTQPTSSGGALGGGLTIEDLKSWTRISDTQLDTEIKTDDLHILAGCFDNYNDYLDKLRLPPPEQADMKKVELSQNHQSAMREALRLWWRHDPETATFRELLSIVIALGKDETVMNVCKYITDNIPKCK